MKLKLAMLAALAVATLPLVATSQSIPRAGGAVTDSQISQMTGRVRHAVMPNIRRSPIAYGFVNSNGTLASGSGNISSSWDGARYVIPISGVNYYYSSFSTTVTPSIPNSTGSECRTDSVSGNLLVYCYDLAGNTIQAAFGFITF